MNELILATGNKGKILELQTLLSPIHCIPQHQLGVHDAEETGLSFLENALIKARHASRLTNKPALADDSGLVVTSLNGRPGIYSARFAGPNATDQDNIQQLLLEMRTIPFKKRQAYFYCALVLIRHAEDPTPLVATGQLAGLIHDTPKGHHGFGYDPIFYLEEQDCTMAELPATLKNTISHRALALKQLRTLLLEESL